MPRFLPLFLIICFSVSSNDVFSQKFMEKMVQNSCECVDNIPISQGNSDYYNEFDTCFMKSIAEYEVKLKKEYGVVGEKLFDNQLFSETFLWQLSLKCPKTLRTLIELLEMELEGIDYDFDYEYEMSSVEDQLEVEIGKLIEIVDSTFPTFRVYIEKVDAIIDFVWYEEDSNFDYINKEYMKFIDQDVIISYYKFDLIDAESKENQTFRGIVSVE